MGRNKGNITVAHIELQKPINYRYKRSKRYKYKNKYTNKYITFPLPTVDNGDILHWPTHVTGQYITIIYRTINRG